MPTAWATRESSPVGFRLPRIDSIFNEDGSHEPLRFCRDRSRRNRSLVAHYLAALGAKSVLVLERGTIGAGAARRIVSYFSALTIR